MSSRHDKFEKYKVGKVVKLRDAEQQEEKAPRRAPRLLETGGFSFRVCTSGAFDASLTSACVYCECATGMSFGSVSKATYTADHNQDGQ